MATVVDAGKNLVKLSNGQTITANKGGWYDGQQYWGGTLSEVGVINSLSDQVGAGQAVSKEVVQQTNPDNWNFIQNTKAAGGGKASGGSSPQSVTQQLSSFQNNVFQNADSVASSVAGGVQSLADIAKGLKDSGLLPAGEAPVAPKLAETFQQLSDAKGVDAIQTSITALKAQQDEIASQLQINKTAEKGKLVAQGVIEGRISKESQQAQDQYDFIGRQLARKQDELTSTLSNIKMIMDFTQTDYKNASDSYNTQFDQAITTFNLIHGIQQDQKTEAQRATDNARANLQIMANAITAGNMSVGSLSPDQQAQLNKLEVQAGLPVGFISSLKMDPKANILFTSSNNGVTQVGVRNADGSVSVQSYGTPTGGGTTAEKKDYYTNSAIKDARNGAKLGQMFSIYQGVLEPNEIYTLYNSNSKYGPDTGDIEALRKYGVTLAQGY